MKVILSGWVLSMSLVSKQFRDEVFGGVGSVNLWVKTTVAKQFGVCSAWCSSLCGKQEVWAVLLDMPEGRVKGSRISVER